MLQFKKQKPVKKLEIPNPVQNDGRKIAEEMGLEIAVSTKTDNHGLTVVREE